VNITYTLQGSDNCLLLLFSWVGVLGGALPHTHGLQIVHNLIAVIDADPNNPLNATVSIISTYLRPVSQYSIVFVLQIFGLFTWPETLINIPPFFYYCVHCNVELVVMWLAKY
jgi:hypothetical protein